MKAVYVAMMAAAGIMMAGQAYADEGADLAKAKNCMSCHAIDKKLVGPAYKDVAAKYKGDAKAPAMLAAKVKAGGKGVWGEIPMPPNNVTPEEANKLVAWVLSQK
ncbi:MAG: c-type cytochrome [Azonexus sp.]